MNLDEIKKLIEILDDSSISEFELEAEGTRLMLKKGVPEAPSRNFAAADSCGKEAFARSESADSFSVQQNGTNFGKENEKSESSLYTISAPMVGTFYRAPAPDAPPFVNVGDIVEVGQTVCIVEAMKLMNEIESEVRGKVIKIIPENAEPVEYGQELFIIEKL